MIGWFVSLAILRTGLPGWTKRLSEVSVRAEATALVSAKPRPITSRWKRLVAILDLARSTAERRSAGGPEISTWMSKSEDILIAVVPLDRELGIGHKAVAYSIPEERRSRATKQLGRIMAEL